MDALALTRRRGMSLTMAARTVRTDPRTVRRHVGLAFRREGRRWRPTRFDRLAREMTVLTAQGPRHVLIRDSRTASLLAEHANAVQHYLRTGDTGPLQALRRKDIQLHGERLALALAPGLIDRLAEGAELHYEVYRR